VSKKHQKRAQRAGGKTPHQPEDPRLVQGRKAFARADYGQAIALWERLLTAPVLTPEKRAQVQRALAEAYFRVGQHVLFMEPQKAVQHLTHAAELMPTDALYAYHVGLAHHRQQRLEAAVLWYKQALQRDPHFVRAAQMLALAEKPAKALKAGEAQQMLVQCQQVFGTGPAQPLFDALRAAEAGAWAEAEGALTALPVHELPLLAQGLVFYYQGLIAQRGGDTEKAYPFWSRAFETGLHTPALIENLTNSILLQAEVASAANRPELVQKLVQQGLQAAPSPKQFLEMKAYLGLQQGYAEAEAGDWQAALESWSALAGLGGQQGRAALINTALALEKLENWRSAAENWRDFARRRPRNESSEGWLAPEEVARLWERISGLYIRAGNPDEAVKTLQTALKYEPENPRLLLALARCYVDAGRYEAAQNQLDKLLAVAPDHIEALILCAEVSELDPGLSFRRRTPEPVPGLSFLPTGIPEWEAVLARNDETYNALARERLEALYDQACGHALYFNRAADSIIMLSQRAFTRLPDNHYLRARCVQALLRAGGKKGCDEADRQIEQIDLTDSEALHQLIDGFHTVDAHKEAAALLAKAEALKPLDTVFYMGIANCAFDRGQAAIGEAYFDEAIKRSATREDREKLALIISTAHIQANQFEKAEASLLKLLAVDANNGLAQFILTLLLDRRGDRSGARQHLREAGRYTDRASSSALYNAIQTAKRASEARPPVSLWSIFGPGLSRPGGPFESDEEFDDFDTFDAFEDLPPMPQRRRR
jgi:tetratricopeptide (TPR) repeat protein